MKKDWALTHESQRTSNAKVSGGSAQKTFVLRPPARRAPTAPDDPEMIQRQKAFRVERQTFAET